MSLVDKTRGRGRRISWGRGYAGGVSGPASPSKRVLSGDGRALHALARRSCADVCVSSPSRVMCPLAAQQPTKISVDNINTCTLPYHDLERQRARPVMVPSVLQDAAYQRHERVGTQEDVPPNWVRWGQSSDSVSALQLYFRCTMCSTKLQHFFSCFLPSCCMVQTRHFVCSQKTQV